VRPRLSGEFHFGNRDDKPGDRRDVSSKETRTRATCLLYRAATSSSRASVSGYRRTSSTRAAA
jgi:hypothetical protein